MSKDKLRLDVSALFQALREQAGQPGEGVRLRQADPMQRISDRAAARVGSLRSQPDVSAVLDTLREQAGRLAGQARFHSVGTVQHVGNGVATLSGLQPGSRPH
jgi:hypothetical protein